jgi:hypothetical protein
MLQTYPGRRLSGTFNFLFALLLRRKSFLISVVVSRVAAHSGRFLCRPMKEVFTTSLQKRRSSFFYEQSEVTHL